MMRPFESIMSLEEARRILGQAAIPLDRTERLALDDAAGRVLAMDVRAPRDVPAFDRSAMDGYAVRARDTNGASRTHPVALRALGRVYAGETTDTPVDTGTCMEIATGAPLPPGADAVVMVEETAAPAGVSKIGGDVQVFAEARQRQNVVARAADMREGDVLMSHGAHLTASRIGALAAIGVGHVDVYVRPAVAILPTGDELTPLDKPLPPGHVYDVNRYTLASVVRQHGGLARVFPTVADTLDAVRQAIAGVSTLANVASAGAAGAAPSLGGAVEDRSARNSDAKTDAGPIDLLVLTGGSSVGEHDLVIDILREQGEVLFHGIAVKPGKPTALARIGRLLVLGMPGNPTSCLSNAYVLLVPLLRSTARLPPHQPQIVQATLTVAVESPRDRHQFMPVRIEGNKATPTFKGSGEITSLSRADGYFEIPTSIARIDAGTIVAVTLY